MAGKFRRLLLFTTISLILLISLVSFAGVLHFEHADVVYPNLRYIDTAVRVGNIFESVRQDVINLVGYDPGRITIILQDKGTVSNGYTQVLLHKTIVLYTWPTEGYMGFYLPLEDWYTYLIIHEFTHMCHLSYQDELGKFISLITGIPYLPQLSSPFVEGTTVFSESSFSLSSGRLNNPFFSSGLYYYSLPNFPSFSYKETMPSDDYRGGLLYYNFTAGFYKYLADTYGIDSVKKFLNVTSQTNIPFLTLGATQTTQDPYESVFGKKFDELYTDWIMSLTKLDYNQGKLVYNLRNSLILRVDSAGKEIALLRQTFGPVSSYVGAFESGLVFIDDAKFKQTKDIPLNADEVKIDGDNIYALQPSQFLDKVEKKLWLVNQNKVIASGYITSFGVNKGEVYVSLYDPVSLKSKVKSLNDNLFEYTYYGYIKNMDVSENYIALLTLDNNIIILDKKYKEVAKIKDRNMKGPYVKLQGNKVLFSRVEGNYIIPYYYDIEGGKFYRLAEKTLLSDFTIHNNELYYVSYTPYGNTGGNGIYKKEIQLQELSELPNENSPSKVNIAQHKYVDGDELAFRINEFLKPVTWAPMYSYTQLEDSSLIYTLYMIFTFTNIENDTAFVLTPILDIAQNDPESLDFQILGYRQFVGFLKMGDYYGISASYIYPSNDYGISAELLLGSFDLSPKTSVYALLGINSRSSKDYNLDSVFSLISGISAPSIKLNTLSFGLYMPTYIFSRPVQFRNWVILSNDDYTKLFDIDSVYFEHSVVFALNTDTSFLGLLQWNLSQPENIYYDTSLAFTLFKDSAELFGGNVLFRNSGLTIGFANPAGIHGIYTQFFVETYLAGMKLYPNAGVFVQLMDLYGLPAPDFQGIVYIGLGNSPHMLNILSGMPY